MAQPQPEVTNYVVRPGDTLSSIAQRFYGSQAKWVRVWWDNAHLVPDPDLIIPGQKLTIHLSAGPVTITSAMETAAYRALPKPPPPPVTVVTTSAVTSQTPAPSSGGSSADVSTAGDSAFQACVISRESGGDPDIWNASGHWGLYQFSEATWYANGGPPGSFGNASQAVQNDIFWNTFRADGTQPWAPSDGC